MNVSAERSRSVWGAPGISAQQLQGDVETDVAEALPRVMRGERCASRAFAATPRSDRPCCGDRSRIAVSWLST